MSWSIKLEEHYGGDFDTQVDKAIAGWRNDNPAATDDLIEQVVAAGRAAKLIASSGSVGRDEGVRFYGSLQGHANPDHLPRDGWAQDTVGVYVNQAKERSPFVPEGAP